jgi:hypothetical protein
MKKLLLLVLLLSTNLILFPKAAESNQGKSLCHQQLTNPATIVLVCTSPNAYAYHRYVCSGLSRCSYSVVEMSINAASERAYRPCKICFR